MQRQMLYDHGVVSMEEHVKTWRHQCKSLGKVLGCDVGTVVEVMKGGAGAIPSRYRGHMFQYTSKVKGGWLQDRLKKLLSERTCDAKSYLEHYMGKETVERLVSVGGCDTWSWEDYVFVEDVCEIVSGLPCESE